MKEKYPWLEQDTERKNMSDREILDKYVDFKKSHLSDSEKKQVMDMLYKYKDAFSLRDEIGTWSNIEVEIMLQINQHSLQGHIMLRRKIKTYWRRK